MALETSSTLTSDCEHALQDRLRRFPGESLVISISPIFYLICMMSCVSALHPRSPHARTQNHPFDVSILRVFARLPAQHLYRILSFHEDDWQNYYRLRKLEVFANRPDGWDESDESQTLTERLFARWNKHPNLDYPLYVAMSEAEQDYDDMLKRKR